MISLYDLVKKDEKEEEVSLYDLAKKPEEVKGPSLYDMAKPIIPSFKQVEEKILEPVSQPPKTKYQKAVRKMEESPAFRAAQSIPLGAFLTPGFGQVFAGALPPKPYEPGLKLSASEVQSVREFFFKEGGKSLLPKRLRGFSTEELKKALRGGLKGDVEVSPVIKVTGKQKLLPEKISKVTPKEAGPIIKEPTLTHKMPSGKMMAGPEHPGAVPGTTKAVAPLAQEVPAAVLPKHDSPSVLLGFEERRQRVMEAIKQAKPIRSKQEQLYTEERRRRIARAEEAAKKVGGQAGYIEQLKALKGKLPKEKFEPVKLPQEDVDGLFNDIEYHPDILPFQKITAKNGLAKLLGEEVGAVPTSGELSLLNKVFGKDFVSVVQKKRHIISRLGEAGVQLANIPRSVMSSFDLSFGGRQGIFAAPAYRKQFMASWKRQFKIMGSENAYIESQKKIVADPNFELATESGLQFTEVGQAMELREERFASQWAEKIPLVGRGIRASGRAYTAFANEYRMSIFNDMVEQAERQGLEPKNNLGLTTKMANLTNIITGRGSLPAPLERSALLLNAFFFSPRLVSSRVSILNPVTYINQPPSVRKDALKTLLSFAGYAATILTAAKMSGFADVELDSTSTDFLKLKIGNTRVDIMGGLQQYMVLASRLLQNKYKSSITGETKKLGEGYKPLTRYNIALRAVEAKEAPIFSFITELAKGTTFKGEPTSVLKAASNRMKPMVLTDLYDIAVDDPKLLPLWSLAFFGVGMQTYEAKPSKIKFTKF